MNADKTSSSWYSPVLREIVGNCAYFCLFIILFSITFWTLFAITFTYLGYRVTTYSPQTYFGYPLYFDYDQRSVNDASIRPTAVVELHKQSGWFNEEKGIPFVSQIVVQLEMPESDVNLHRGMFMVYMNLSDANQRTVFSSARPCILRYKSYIRRVAETWLFMPLYFLGMLHEKQVQNLEMVVHNDTFQLDALNQKIQQASKVTVALSDKQVQLYAARLHFLTQLSGFSYLAYTYPLIVFTLLLLFFGAIDLACACCCSAACTAFAVYKHKSSKSTKNKATFWLDEIDEAPKKDRLTQVSDKVEIAKTTVSITNESSSSGGTTKQVKKEIVTTVKQEIKEEVKETPASSSQNVESLRKRKPQTIKTEDNTQ